MGEDLKSEVPLCQTKKTNKCTLSLSLKEIHELAQNSLIQLIPKGAEPSAKICPPFMKSMKIEQYLKKCAAKFDHVTAHFSSLLTSPKRKKQTTLAEMSLECYN